MSRSSNGPSNPATSGNKQERIYRLVHERILSGAYSPGYRLVIDTLADEFGVSALPVREAIRRLEAEGLVVYQPNAGPRVSPANPIEFVEALSVLAVLEGYATALAAPHIDATRIEQLTETNEQMVDCLNTLDTLRFGELNRKFHYAIYDRCPSVYLVEMLKETDRRLGIIRRTIFTQIPYRGLESIEEHRELISLIRAGASAEQLEATTRAHKLRTVETFTKLRDMRETQPQLTV